MASFKMSDGTIVKTEDASNYWYEDKFFDGRNWISTATGDQWEHQKLFCSRRGRYYILHFSNWEGSQPHAEWVSDEEAARWLIENDNELPEDLADLEEAITE